MSIHIKLKPKESDIQRAIVDYLRATGWFVVRNVTYSQTVYATKGIPDLVAVKKGRTVWIECKRPGGKQSDNQCAFQCCLVAAGGQYILARSVEDVTEAVK